MDASIFKMDTSISKWTRPFHRPETFARKISIKKSIPNFKTNSLKFKNSISWKLHTTWMLCQVSGDKTVDFYIWVGGVFCWPVSKPWIGVIIDFQTDVFDYNFVFASNKLIRSSYKALFWRLYTTRVYKIFTHFLQETFFLEIFLHHKVARVD